LGTWEKQDIKITFKNNAKGILENFKTDEYVEFTYSLTSDQIKVLLSNQTEPKIFKLQLNNNFISEHITNGKKIHRVFTYRFQQKR
jgi:hypothetical protein